jgi:hypothetical protein
MKRLIVQIAVLVGILNLLLPVIIVKADLSPKSTMKFVFKFEGQPVAIVSGEQFECTDPTCRDVKPLQVLGPQGFTCTADSCRSTGYGYAPYHKLVIRFADRTRESNIFQKRAFSASFDVTVTESGLQVEETFANVNLLPALFATLLIETFVAGLYLLVFRLRRAVLKSVPFASLITLPLVWFFILRSSLPAVTSTGLAEVSVVLFEAVFLYGLNRNTLPLKHAIAMSLVMNAASFLIPLLLEMWLRLPWLAF